MEIVGTYKYFIDAYLSDFRGRATLPMIGGFMLQAATRHAEERDFGYSSMSRKNRAWVLSRMIIEMYEYPSNDTFMTINTWVANVTRIFTERCFSFEDQNGKEIGFARSVWASIDLDTRRPTNVLELEGLTGFVNKERLCPLEDMKKIRPLPDASPSDEFIVKYSDIDINQHLNSMKYIEHFVDVFDLDMFKGKEIRRFEINYIAEAYYGTPIQLLKEEEQPNIFVLEMKDKDKVVSTSRILWHNMN